MTFRQRLLSEFLGTAGLLVVVVGSGIMGETLAKGNAAIALLANSIATGAGLYALIQAFGPISGAHFNPVVTLAERIWGRITNRELIGYIIVQVVGAVLGVWAAHLMFGHAMFQLSSRERAAPRLLLSEMIATGGLILVIALSGKKRVEVIPGAVALYITAAYWCTSSTSFANPAVTIARSLTDTFSGIQPQNAPLFIVAQVLGALAAIGIAKILSAKTGLSSTPS